MTNSIRLLRKPFQGLLVGLIVLMLNGCEQVKESQATATNYLQSVKKRRQSHQQLWCRMQDNFEVIHKQNHAHDHPTIQKHVKKFSQPENSLVKMSIQAAPYLYYIVDQLEQRNMPGELALIPMLESAFKPHATSHRGAAGLWQFIPSTGRVYGLTQDAWYDGRRDIQASTQAALAHLEFLYQTFDRNWILAIAAYNAGEGKVLKAIQQNKRAGKPITFWDLKLPKETREYVTKLLALALIVHNPEKHAVELPHLENKPYFVPVNPGTPIHFHQAAKLADIDVHELKKLNPGYRKGSTHPKGPQEILLPIANAEKFEYNLAKNR